MALTIKQPITGTVEDLAAGREASFAKPGELVEMHGAHLLTEFDRKVFNTLVFHALKDIHQDREHRIRKADLKGSHNGNERLAMSLRRLKTTLVRVTVVRDGRAALREVQLLGATDTHKTDDGYVYFSFPPQLLEILRTSAHWARLQMQVMLNLTSKYSVTLYEMVQKRVNLEHKSSEDFNLDEIRTYLAVEPGKLPRYQDLRRRVLEPAARELTELSDCIVSFTPITRRRETIGVRLHWLAKSPDAVMETYRELTRHRLGRKARLKGEAEGVVEDPPLLA